MPSAARADESRSGHVAWLFDDKAALGCLDPNNLKAEVELRLGRVVFLADEPKPEGALVLGTSVTQLGEQYMAHVDLVTADGRALGERDLAASSCEELGALLPVVVSVLLEAEETRVSTPAAKSNSTENIAVPEEPEAGAPPEPPTPVPSPPSAGFPVDARPEPQEAVAPATAPQVEKSLAPPEIEEVREHDAPDGASASSKSTKLASVYCVLGGGLLAGYGPVASARVRLGCSYAPLRFLSFELSGEARLPSGRDEPPFFIQGWGGRAAGCLTTDGQIRVGPCLGIGLVQTTGDVELAPGSHERRDRLAAEPSAFLRLAYVSGPLILLADAGASFPAEQPRHVQRKPGSEDLLLHQPWTLLPSLDLSVGYIFR
jgi:hypothetical protein